MKNILLLTLYIMLLVSSCSTPITMGKQYSSMYKEKPLTIAIMPPINQTTHAEAKDYFYTTMYLPLCEKGYYVYSPYLTMEMFQQESAYDAEQFLDGNLSVFHEVLGADAAIFTIIRDWRRSNIGGRITVDIEYILRSTKTGEILYSREGKITLDTSINGGNSGVGALISLVATAINTATTDKVIAGRKCNAFILSDLPAGKYSPMFQKDTSHIAGKKIVTAVLR